MDVCHLSESNFSGQFKVWIIVYTSSKSPSFSLLITGPLHNEVYWGHVLLTWFNFNPNMDE